MLQLVLWGLLIALLYIAYRLGMIKAELNFCRLDADRYGHLRKKSIRINDGPLLRPEELDRILDAELIAKRVNEHYASHAA